MRHPFQLTYFKILLGIIYLLSVEITTGCSHIHYGSEGKIPVFVGRMPEHDQVFSSKGAVHFYFFGLLPQHQYLKLDELAHQQGFSEISKIVITETTDWDDLLWGFLSLGFYTPRSYQITGLGKRM